VAASPASPACWAGVANSARRAFAAYFFGSVLNAARRASSVSSCNLYAT
jgi:hypothetical protein